MSCSLETIFFFHLFPFGGLYLFADLFGRQEEKTNATRLWCLIRVFLVHLASSSKSAY
jgi:hypothetical protein